MEFVQFFGRLHPLVLHLPIGILAMAFVMEWMSRKEKFSNLSPAVGVAIQLGMWSAIFASVSGYVLSWEGGYDAILLNRHQWLGIATAVISVIVYFFHKRKTSKAGKKLYMPIFGSLMLTLAITGHLGGSLTHGSDFLTAPFSGENKNKPIAIANMDSALVFLDLIQPIFQQKCNGCHNESKLKGDLLMTTVEGIQKGGKTGAFLEAGNVEKSLFLTRVHLPMEEKKHMPPEGKNQLAKDEITLLEWWVSEGASFEKNIAALQQPEHIKTILNKYAQPDQSVFAVTVEPPNEDALSKLRQRGIPVERISKEHPFVTVNLRGRDNLNKSVLKSLKNIAENIIELDLSNSNADDQLLSYVSNFPHLQKLFLQKTKVTGKKIEALEDLKYLEYLNLYETPLEDEAIQPIAKLVGLRDLYLWKTNVSPTAIAQLKNDRPTLHVNTGIDPSIFGGAQLKPPMIHVGKDIFKDSVRVEFSINFKGVDLFYTLDGSPPDSTSNKYINPILVTQTADIQAIARKKGWTTSPPAQKSIVRAKYEPKQIRLNKKPNDRYKAEGPSSLINFKKGTTSFTEGEWLGYEKKHFTATLDMGSALDISKVVVSALESTGSWIFFPKGIKISISKNGKQYIPVAEKSIPTTAGPEPALTKNFILDFETQQARYIKVEIKSNLTNPKWHPAPGKPCWVFVDEILVE